MYIQSIKIKNLKRLRDLDLSFTLSDGSPRMWTVLIGENGTGKTSILQAIALAAAGTLRVNDLVGNGFAHLVDRRQDSRMDITANFSFTPTGINNRFHPKYNNQQVADKINLTSTVHLNPQETSLRAKSSYKNASTDDDPLDHARAAELPLWFVIGYGVHRTLPESGKLPALARPSVDRMKPLFDSEYPITSTAFIGYYGDEKKARTYSSILKKIIIDTGILPADISDLELRGYGGVSKAADLLERNRFQQKMGSSSVKIPAVALAHGYQSTIAWIADLVGHILLEADAAIDPENFEGLVLIDEIDLYLHPVWQARLIPSLRKVFPRLQFVATTHSPVVLATLSPEEIIRLQTNPQTGDVQHVTPDVETGYWENHRLSTQESTQPDPRVMTGTELYQDYFGLDRLTLNEDGEEIRLYSAIASNPYRTDHQQKCMEDLALKLENKSITSLIKPVKRQ